MDKKQVERFLAVVEHGSMTAAAKALYLKQASVSTSIRELENEVGAELFHRGGRELELTEAGRALVDPAVQVLRSFDEAQAAIDGVTTSGPTGQLFIGCTAALVTSPAIDLLARFCDANPKVELRCEQAPPGLEAFDLLRAGRLELMLHNETPRRDLHRTHYASESMYGVLPPGTDIAQGEVTMSELAPFGFIGVHTAAPSMLRHASGEAATDKLEYRLPAVCDDRRMLAGLVMRGVGATVLPESTALELEKQGAVVRPMDWPRREAWLYYRDGYLSTAAQRFVELVESS